MHTQRHSEIISDSVDDSALAWVRAVFLRPAEMLTVFKMPGSLLTFVCLLCWLKGSRWQKAASIPLELSWECFQQGQFPVVLLGKLRLIFVTEKTEVEWKKRHKPKQNFFLIRNILYRDKHQCRRSFCIQILCRTPEIVFCCQKL